MRSGDKPLAIGDIVHAYKRGTGTPSLRQAAQLDKVLGMLRDRIRKQAHERRSVARAVLLLNQLDAFAFTLQERDVDLPLGPVLVADLFKRLSLLETIERSLTLGGTLRGKEGVGGIRMIVTSVEAMVAQWKLSPIPVWFSIDRTLTKALAQTDLHGVKAEDIHLPYPVTAIELPHGMIEGVDSNGRYTTAGLLLMQHRLTKSLVLQLINQAQCRSISPISTAMDLIALPENVEIDGVLCGEPAMLDRADPAITTIIDGEEQADHAALWRLALNLVLFVASPQAVLTRSSAPAVLRGPHAPVERAQGVACHISTNVSLDKRLLDRNSRNTGCGHKLSYLTLVRGHWRNQPCGPRNSERRLTWINPFYRGPRSDSDAACSHRYSVTADEA